MAESSNSGGLKQMFGAKNKPVSESKRKRKRGKKPTRTQSKESIENDLKGQECSAVVYDTQETVDNNEESAMNVEEKSPALAANEEKVTASVAKEVKSQDDERMATKETQKASEINDECMNKDGRQELETIQEQTSEEQVTKQESAKPDQTSSNKKRKLFLPRSKKRKLSKNKSSVEEDKRVENLTEEATGAVDTKTAEETSAAKESCEKEVNQADAAKFEESAGLQKNENSDASKSPEGVQDKSLGKNNKGKKLKQLASFGRAKKKSEITLVKWEKISNEACGSLGDVSVISERSENSTSQESQNAEIVDNEQPVAANQSDANNDDERNEGMEGEKKEVAKEKKKKGLGFRRISKSNLGKKKSSKNDEPRAEDSPSEKTSAARESDDVSIAESVEKNEDGFEDNKLEHKVEPMANETETADAETEETTGAEAEMKEENSGESEDTGETAFEDSSQVTPKKEKKENILSRSLRKFKSPIKTLQRNKKLNDDENSAVAEDGAKTSEQAENRESSESEQATQDEKSATEDKGEERPFDQEETSKAVKRKKSDLKNANRALKRKKEDGEELSETALSDETADENTLEETSVLKENVKELENQTEVNEKSVDEFNFQVNKELSQQKNNEDEQKESEQSKEEEEEITRESLARDDTQTESKEEEMSRESDADDDTRTEEEITNEAQKVCHKLMKTVIHELKEFTEKKEAKKAVENATQDKKTEESARFSDEDITVVESLQQTSAIDDGEPEREAEEESYDSDVTVATVERLPSHESLIEHKIEPNSEDDGKSSETEHQTEPKPEHEDLSSETETLCVTEIREEQETEPNTEENEMSTIVEGVFQKTESPGGDVTEPNMENKEIRACIEIVSSESEAAQDIGSSDQNETEPDLEDGEVRAINEEVSSETEASRVSETKPEGSMSEILEECKAEMNTEHEDTRDVKEEASSDTETSEVTNENIKPRELSPDSTDGHETKLDTKGEGIQGDNESESAEIKTSGESNKELKPESTAEHIVEPDTEGENIHDIEIGQSSETEATQAREEDWNFKGRVVEVKVLHNESEIHEGSDELATNEPDETQKDEGAEQTQDQNLMHTFQTSSCQNSVEGWIMVHQLDMTEEISRQIKQALMLNSLSPLRRTTACCTIM